MLAISRVASTPRRSWAGAGPRPVSARSSRTTDVATRPTGRVQNADRLLLARPHDRDPFRSVPASLGVWTWDRMGFYGAVVRQWLDGGVRRGRTRLVGVEGFAAYRSLLGPIRRVVESSIEWLWKPTRPAGTRSSFSMSWKHFEHAPGRRDLSGLRRPASRREAGCSSARARRLDGPGSGVWQRVRAAPVALDGRRNCRRSDSNARRRCDRRLRQSDASRCGGELD